MNVVFLVDEFDNYEINHIKSCYAIARVLQQRGAKVEFICRNRLDTFSDINASDELPILIQPTLENTKVLLKDLQPDWLIVYKSSINNDGLKTANEYVSNIKILDKTIADSMQADLLKMRVIESILPSQPQNLKFRTANESDISTYFEWVNDANVRQQSFTVDPVTWEQHQKWFQERLQEQNCVMLVMETDSLPVGQIRFDIKEGIAHIDYSLDNSVRGRHWAEILVSNGINLVSNKYIQAFQAEVKQQNAASIRVFLKQGFTEQDFSIPEIRIFQKPSSNQEVENSI